MTSNLYKTKLKTNYKCGHNGEPIFLDNNPFSIIAYLEWVETDGYKGTSKMCFNCWCDKNEQ